MRDNGVRRREFLKWGSTGLLSLAGNGVLLTSPLRAQSEAPKITMQRNYNIARFYFDPVGLYIEPGKKVRWVASSDGFSVTAFHPDNDNHELRIPEKARPFDSKELRPQEVFEWIFDLPGTYDFFSRPHEVIGMIGRIVVGAPGGPGEKPLGYGSREGRAPIFREVARAFEFVKSDAIVQKKVIPYPAKELGRSFPMY
jgi:plastocyanin